MNLGLNRWTFLLISFLAFGFAFAGAKALTRDYRGSTQSKEGSITVTGCLFEADENRLAMTAKDGRMYLLKSNDPGLRENVGRRLVVTGTISDLDHDDEDSNPEYREDDVALLLVKSFQHTRRP